MTPVGKRFGGLRRAQAASVFVRCLFLAALVIFVSLSRPVFALIDITATNNSIPIGQYPGWTEGDPGWSSLANNRNYAYLGDGWILTALHIGLTDVQFDSGWYEVVSNQVFDVPNPTDWPVQLSSLSDLRLFRIDGDPGVSGLTIASEPPPVGGEVVFIGWGAGRQANETHWAVNDSDPENWIWTEVTDPEDADLSGYKTANPKVKRWGTNAVESDSIFYNPSDPDPLNPIDSDWNYVGTLNGRNMIGLVTDLDETGGTSHEAQAIGGNSGTSVFYKRDGVWELSGIINSIYIYDNQPQSPKATAVYGNATFFSDLSAYYDEIYEIINAHPEYSVMGDVNLDGTVSGDGSGTADVDDVTAFVEGWLFEESEHSIETWKKGDLSLDGKTDLTDFLLLRNALMNSGSGSGAAALSSLLGVDPLAVVPEPGSAMLMAIGLFALLAAAKCRSRSVSP